MPTKTKIATKLLENELRRLENALQSEIKKLRREEEHEKRPTRLRAISEEIIDFERKMSEYRDRLQNWYKQQMREAFDEHGRYRCPRCWLEHGYHSTLTPFDSDNELDNFSCNKCNSFFEVKA